MQNPYIDHEVAPHIPKFRKEKLLSLIKKHKQLIIDDICAGGRTFKELTKAIKDISPECEVHLFVTHGFFNNSVEVIDSLIESGISKIFTTTSVYNLKHKGVTCTK